MSYTLTVLGSSAAVPTPERNLSAHLLEIDGLSFLFDCAEGTQFQLRRFKKKLNKINSIFISHIHGDHFLGLPGLLSTMNLLGRKEKIKLFCPKGIRQILDTVFSISNTNINFEIDYIYIDCDTKTKIFEDDNYSFYAFPLIHSIPTYGFLYEQKTNLLNVSKDFVKKYKPQIDWFKRIKAGEDYIDKEGNIIKNSDIVIAKKKPVSYAYCTDTAYFEKLAEWVKGVRLLYHESTFLNEETEEAIQKEHSTAYDAAKIASMAKAETLLLGHFSSRYKDVRLFKKEAKDCFGNVVLAKDGLVISLR